MRSRTAIILFGHGSRDARWREPMDAVATRVAASGLAVRCAFLELQEPNLVDAAKDLAAAGATHLTVVPMFLGMGRHAREDLPRLVDEIRRIRPALKIELRAPIGEDARMLDLIAAIAGE
jgi:sirohydrochlorin cobaltochelatase